MVTHSDTQIDHGTDLEPRKTLRAKLRTMGTKNTDTHTAHALGFANDFLHMTPKALVNVETRYTGPQENMEEVHAS